MEDLKFYECEEFDPDGVRASDAVARAFLLDCTDIYNAGGQQVIKFTASEFVKWYENEVEVVKRALLNRIYTELSK